MSDFDRRAFAVHCSAVAKVATDGGVSLEKIEGAHVLRVSHAGQRVDLPIVSDDDDWRAMTVDEALYAALREIKAFGGVRLDDETLASLGEEERPEIPVVRRNADDANARSAALANVLGGEEKLAALLVLVDD